MKPIRWATSVGSAVALAATLAGCHLPQHWHSEQLLDDAREPVFSPDGTKIAFVTFAAFSPIDTNDRMDVYLYDIATKTSELVSVNGAGTNGGDADSFNPVFSPDGTTLAFNSFASDLGSTDTNGTVDAYARNLTTGKTALVSVNATGNDSGHGDAGVEVFTPDGSGIVFSSRAADITSLPDNNGTYDIFLRHLNAGHTELLSGNAAGTATADGISWYPKLTADGSALAFTSNAGDLGPPDRGDRMDDVFLRELDTGATTLVSVNAAGTGGGNGRSFTPQVAADGSWVVFSSDAGDLGSTDTNGVRDVYVRDLRNATTKLVSVNAAGTDSGDRGTTEFAVSPDGRLVAFATASTNLGPPDPGDSFDHDVYVRDLQQATTKLVSVNAAGTDGGNEPSFAPVFSPDGKRLAFDSDANDLGPTDTNVCVIRTAPFPCTDIYVQEVDSGKLSLASSSGEDSLPATFSRGAVFHPTDHDKLAFSTRVSNEDIYLSTR